jgi:hypothetical protein
MLHYKKSCILPGNNARSKYSWQICQELCQGKLLANLPGATPHKSRGKMYGTEKILVWSGKAGRYNTLPGVVPPKNPWQIAKPDKEEEMSIKLSDKFLKSEKIFPISHSFSSLLPISQPSKNSFPGLSLGKHHTTLTHRIQTPIPKCSDRPWWCDERRWPSAPPPDLSVSPASVVPPPTQPPRLSSSGPRFAVLRCRFG